MRSKKVVCCLAVALALLLVPGTWVLAAEHPGGSISEGGGGGGSEAGGGAQAATVEHPGGSMEHPGGPMAKAGTELREFSAPKPSEFKLGAGQGEHPGEHPGAKPGAAAAKAEHPKGEHPRAEAGAPEGIAFAADEVRGAINDHIQAELARQGGQMQIFDAEQGANLQLDFVRVHEDRVSYIDEGPDAGKYFACSDFKTADGKIVDIDFWMKPNEEGALKVVDTKIHKFDGVARFAYVDDQIVEVA